MKGGYFIKCLNSIMKYLYSIIKYPSTPLTDFKRNTHLEYFIFK